MPQRYFIFSLLVRKIAKNKYFLLKLNFKNVTEDYIDHNILNNVRLANKITRKVKKKTLKINFLCGNEVVKDIYIISVNGLKWIVNYYFSNCKIFS